MDKVIDLPDYSIYGMFKERNSNLMWISTKYSGIYRFNLQTGNYTQFSYFTGLPTINYTFRITGDNKGKIYCGTGYEGALEYDGENWVIYNTLNSDIPNNDVYAVECNHFGETWLGTFGGLAKLKNDGTWKIYESANSDLPDNYIRNIICKNEFVVVATASGGLAILNTNYDTWKVFNKENSNLPSNNVWDIAVASNGDIWVALLENGIAKLSNFFDEGNIDVGVENEFKPFYNSKERNINISLNTSKDIVYTLHLMDTSGKYIKQISFSGSGGNESEIMNVENYPKGIYFLVLMAGKSRNRKILIYD
ncbi:MAG: hypothetical protein IPO92_11800 [Saprospiraceae bacterium]|nr:hypothetical protein [Saprospiraceae bacterium]